MAIPLAKRRLSLRSSFSIICWERDDTLQQSSTYFSMPDNLVGMSQHTSIIRHLSQHAFTMCIRQIACVDECWAMLQHLVCLMGVICYATCFVRVLAYQQGSPDASAIGGLGSLVGSFSCQLLLHLRSQAFCKCLPAPMRTDSCVLLNFHKLIRG